MRIFFCSQELTVDHAAQFIEKLAKVSEELLLQFDGLLTIDDIERGRKLHILHFLV